MRSRSRSKVEVEVGVGVGVEVGVAGGPVKGPLPVHFEKLRVEVDGEDGTTTKMGLSDATVEQVLANVVADMKVRLGAMTLHALPDLIRALRAVVSALRKVKK